MFEVMTTESRATYQVRELDAQSAENYGCPGADVMLIGRNGHMIGQFMAIGGKPGEPIRVPCWPTRKGCKVLFVPWGELGDGTGNTTAVFSGWAD